MNPMTADYNRGDIKDTIISISSPMQQVELMADQKVFFI